MPAYTLRSMAEQKDTRITITLGSLYRPAGVAVEELGFESVQELLRTALREKLMRWGRLGKEGGS